MLKKHENQDIGMMDAFSYLGVGFQMALSKECRIFVLIPILINIVILSLGGYLTVNWLLGWVDSYISGLPEWLSGILSWILGFLLSVVVGYILCFFFSTIATLIASPFYGLLAERAEKVIRGTSVGEDDASFSDIIKDIPRILNRELRKWMFYLPRLLLCCVISIIPVINIVSPICWFLLAAWMMSIQYMDYAYDNHKISFEQMRKDLWCNRMGAFTLGASVSIMMLVPILNLLVPPAAVCAGTKFYVESQKRISPDKLFRQN